MFSLFPINDYYDGNVFHERVFFESESCPTHEQVVQVLIELDNEDRKLAESKEPIGVPILFEARQCLETIDMIEGEKKLPFLYTNMILTNVFYIHPKYGRQSISVQRLTIHKV